MDARLVQSEHPNGGNGIQAQIDRISGAVQDALTAIADKGVTVPAGTKVDGLASLIAAIEAGGGGGAIGDIARYATGTFILAENTTSAVKIADIKEVIEKLGTPTLKYYYTNSKSNCFLFAEPVDDISPYPNMQYAFASTRHQKTTSNAPSMAMFTVNSSGSSMSVSKWNNANIFSADENDLKVTFTSSGIGYAGIKYTWLIVRVLE